MVSLHNLGNIFNALGSGFMINKQRKMIVIHTVMPAVVSVFLGCCILSESESRHMLSVV